MRRPLSRADEMNSPKRHHYVPQMLSKRFLGSEGKLYFHDKRRPAKAVLPTVPHELMHQRYLYSSENDDGTRDHSLEERFSRLESKMSPLLDDIEAMLQNDTHPIVEGNNRRLLDLFVYEQWRRVPDFHV